MAQIKFDQVNTGDTSDNLVRFFALKNDGDEAVVRIMHDTTDSFDLVTTHLIQHNNKYRRVNCIRDPREPLENCPLCKAGVKIQQRMYIHLIEYVKDDYGKIIPQGKIWERSATYAMTIKNLIDEYGPLSDCIFKIRRNGKPGSRETTYSILYGNPQMYKVEDYPKDETIFKNYSAVGTAVLDKSFEELAEFLATGKFTSNTVTDKNDVVDTNINDTRDLPFTMSDDKQHTYDSGYVQRPNVIGGDTNTTSQIQRPVRYY